MTLRMRTRITIWMSMLTMLAVLVMTIMLLSFAAALIGERYYNQGRLMTTLASRNVEQGLMVPDKVMRAVGEQMVVSALLTAELVAQAEAAGRTPGEISDVLRRVIERSSDVEGVPLINEFWVTDGTGRAYIHTEPAEFTFTDGDGDNQSEAFLPLLSPEAKPVVQDLQPRKLDGMLYMYVGVGGVDKPRIVQTGLSGERFLEVMRQGFDMDDLLSEFIKDMEVDRMAVINEKGEVFAEVGNPLFPGRAIADSDVVAMATEFLKSPAKEPFELRDFVGPDDGLHVGVVTRLQAPDNRPPTALFMQYQTATMFSVMRESARLVLYIGAALMLTAVLVSIWLSRKLTRPVVELTGVVQKFGGGNLGLRAYLPKADKEVKQLAQSFNTMAEQLQIQMLELERETSLRERLESEMRIGAEVQRSLLPEKPPVRPWLQVSAQSLQAREVGGDFYDYIELSDGGVGFAIGDATDKGLPAALLSTQCASMFHVLAEDGVHPAQVLYHTNNAVCAKICATGRFITAFLLYLQPDGRVRYSGAGHCHPLVWRSKSGELTSLHGGEGLPLGVQGKSKFGDLQDTLHPGDVILFYSDGITEARGADGLYGERRLADVLRVNGGGDVHAILEAILKSLRDYTGSDEVHDDATLLVLRYAGPGRQQ